MGILCPIFGQKRISWDVDEEAKSSRFWLMICSCCSGTIIGAASGNRRIPGTCDHLKKRTNASIVLFPVMRYMSTSLSMGSKTNHVGPNQAIANPNSEKS